MNSHDPPVARGRSAFRDEFPIRGEGLYFNHAAIGPWPRCAGTAVRAFADENQRRGPLAYADWIRREASLRKRLARLTGAGSADDIALLKNTTEGISTVAWGLAWRDGDNVVLPALEFASNRLPWLAQARAGVELREVDVRAGADPEAALIGAMDRRTRLLTVSAVQWSDGFRLDLQRLGEACRRRSVLFFVDAIQQLGALPVDVQACHIDYLAADAHKWLLGPEGIAVFYSSPAARPLLELRQQGWHMVDQPFNFARDEWIPSDTATRFEAGSPNSLGQVALHASVGLLLQQGMQDVGRRVLANSAGLLEGLAAVPGIRPVSRTEPERRSGIVAFACDRIRPRELSQRLTAAGVACALRGDAIRLSPHFYQGEEEIEAFLRCLAKALQNTG